MAAHSPDEQDRVQDFLARHGGPSTRPREGAEYEEGASGWTEIYAADGYTLRCDWSRMGSRQEMQYVEKPPLTSSFES